MPDPRKRDSHKSDKRKRSKKSKAELDIERAKKAMLKLVSNEIKTRLQPQYAQGLISRERFKAVIESSSKACAPNVMETQDGTPCCSICALSLSQCPCLSEHLQRDYDGVTSPRGPSQREKHREPQHREKKPSRGSNKKDPRADPRAKSGRRTPSPSYSRSPPRHADPFSPPRAGDFKPELPLVEELFEDESHGRLTSCHLFSFSLTQLLRGAVSCTVGSFVAVYSTVHLLNCCCVVV